MKCEKKVRLTYTHEYLRQQEMDDLPLSKCYNSPLTSTSELPQLAHLSY